MINRIIGVILRILAVLFIGVVLGVIGFIAGSMIFAIFGFEFYGRQGYEAGGPIGFVLGALIGLVGSGLLLFRKPVKPVIHEKAQKMENKLMTTPLKTNRLAILSTAAGLIAFLITLGLLIVSIRLLSIPAGSGPSQFPTMMPGFGSVLIRLAGFASLGAIVTGVLALLEVKRKSGTEKGKLLAWAGIMLGSSWILFLLAFALFWILALIPAR